MPAGRCGCGCGAKTRIPIRNRPERGHFKGVPLSYIDGHNRKGQIKMGSREWMRANDPAALREYWREKTARYYAAHKEKWRRYAAKPEVRKKRSEKRLLTERTACPLCSGQMTITSAGNMTAACRDCMSMVIYLEQRFGAPSREVIRQYIQSLTTGEKEQWSSAITLRKAIKPLQGLLKRPEKTQSSPTLEKTRKSSSS